MKKRSKLLGSNQRIPSIDSGGVRKTERSAVAVISNWVREIIDTKQLRLGGADVDTTGSDAKSPDLVIRMGPNDERIVLLAEFKQPYFDAFDEKELKEPAHRKAVRRQAPYFATSNFKQIIWYSTESATRMESLERQILGIYPLSELENLDLLEESRFREPTQRGLQAFLEDLVQVHFHRQEAPRLPLDQLLVLRLRALIEALARRLQNVVADRAHKDRTFEKALRKWFDEQQWSYRGDEADFARAARQAAYLLANKLLFYHVLQIKRPGELDRLEIPKGLTRGGILRKHLKAFFDEVVEHIDYETIYSSDFIDDIAFPDDEAAVHIVRGINDLLARHDVGKLGYDILGPIFERLIPAEERHILGQYFTNAEVVDLILGFCIRNEKDSILDPSCGAGTFLVRAYQHKKLLNPRLQHEEILRTLWGVDIAKFPAHLSMINLAVNDLSSRENYP